MDAKENALKIIRFGQPAYVAVEPPIFLTRYQGSNHEDFQGELGDDHPVGSRWNDIWQTGWHKIHDGTMGLPEGNPLADVKSLKQYHWPDPNDERICTKIYRMAEDFPGDDRFLAGNHRDTLWEKAYMLVGMENTMMYFHTEPQFAREVLHGIMDFQLGIAQHYADIGVELVRFTDDLGMQDGPLLGPVIVNEFLVPEYRRLFDFYKERDVLIWFHSCGNVESVVQTLMELGVDILNPVQATANDLIKIRFLTQNRMALHGGVSSATIMAGPVERIKQEVRERIHRLGVDGGYFCSKDQGMPFPKTHIEALQEAVTEYGQYPIQA